MDFYAVLDHVVALLQQRGRVTYNALKLQFQPGRRATGGALKDELFYAHPQVVEDAGRGLRWTGDIASAQGTPVPSVPQPTSQPSSQPDHPRQDASLPASPHPPEAERRQLTVLFCDLADSTRLAGSSTLKTSARSSVPIKPPASPWSSVLPGMWPSTWVMVTRLLWLSAGA